MKRFMLALVALFLLATPLHAQTTSAVLQWQHADTLVNVQGYSFILKVDTSNPAVVSATCVATSPTLTTCTTPMVVAFNVPHTIVLAAYTGGGTASATLNYVPPPAPVPASQLKVIIQITVP
jgi:hypothetical protein